MKAERKTEIIQICHSKPEGLKKCSIYTPLQEKMFSYPQTDMRPNSQICLIKSDLN